ncbi:zf-HC2 domain-containing protein [Duganella sp. FT3S]|uniref:Zf-HC2 domain-containing protein n=1 Tax=Rugamonas fusca TaxID=2758568 RepID=A0A7W2EL74_9BURK|nr:zf-HC2 domain-containing protein [Rugamonas fusca]MBA5607963.1 zf-HC2 domain-containing protein [Rugamonas fusca]
MNGHTVKLDDPAHEDARTLLPWYVAGRLDAADSAAVRRHLADCPACRAELDYERRVQAAAALPDRGGPASAAATEATDSGAVAGLDVERALAALMPRLEPERPAPATGLVPGPARPWWRRAAANDASWLRWALAAQFAVIAGLGLLLARPAPERGAYHVLGAGAAAGNLVVVFKPDTPERDLRRILQANGAHVVDGPTVTDAYLLSVPDADAARARLRTESAVVLAEALERGTRP